MSIFINDLPPFYFTEYSDNNKHYFTTKNGLPISKPLVFFKLYKNQYPIIKAMDMATAQITTHIIINFHANFSHCVYVIRATANAPINVADVGNRILLIASPYWNASTVI